MFTARVLNGENKEIDGVYIASWSPGNTNVVIVDPNGVVTDWCRGRHGYRDRYGDGDGQQLIFNRQDSYRSRAALELEGTKAVR